MEVHYAILSLPAKLKIIFKFVYFSHYFFFFCVKWHKKSSFFKEAAMSLKATEPHGLHKVYRTVLL